MAADVKFDSTYFPLVGVVFVVHLVLHQWVNPALCAHFCPRVQNLARGKQIYWYAR